MVNGHDAGGTADYYLANVISASDYYPYGWVIPDRKFTGDYRYVPIAIGINGQEQDTEWRGGQAVSFRFRIHDPRLGRFLSVDPLAPEYPWNSTFAFAENRIIDGFELEGLEVVLVNPNATGATSVDKLIYRVGTKNTNKDAIHIYAHGDYRGFKDEYSGTWVNTTGELLAVLRKSDLWKSDSKISDFVIVLHSCRAGRTTKAVGESVAQKLSRDAGALIIAADERVRFVDLGVLEYERGPVPYAYTDADGNYINKEKAFPLPYSGNWITYYKGEEVHKMLGIEGGAVALARVMRDRYLDGEQKEVVNPNPDISDNFLGSKHGEVYIVQRGDNLSKIAKEYNTTVKNIKTLNNLTSDLIHPGQNLTISEATGRKNESKEENSSK